MSPFTNLDMIPPGCRFAACYDYLPGAILLRCNHTLVEDRPATLHSRYNPVMTSTSENRPQLDIALLPHLSRLAREHLRRAGITSLHQFAALTIEELQQIKGIKTTAAALRANARAYVENRPVWVNLP